MALNSASFETSEFKVTVKRYGTGWYVQVMTGPAMVKHVETIDFGTYKECVNYIFSKYNFIAD